MTDHSLNRYHRQMLLSDIGEHGQRRLLNAHALIVGCGALGCAIADLLARAGTGTITIVDRDVVEVTNLQRQTLFDERHARDTAPKAEAAADRLRRVNSTVRIRPIIADFTHANAESVLGPDDAPRPDVLLDGTDNLATRYLLNDLSVRHSIPYVYGGAVSSRGMTMTLLPRSGGPCLRCVYPDLPADASLLTCDTAGILGPVVSIVAAYQATEATKILVGRPDLCSDTLLDFDPWSNRSRRISIAGARNPDCVCCGDGDRRFEFLEGRHAQRVAVICTRNNGGAVQITPPTSTTVNLHSLGDKLRSQGTFVASDHVLRGVLVHEQSDSAFPIELTVFNDGRTIVRGTTEAATARAIHARYVGS